jgi:hypothetical protein
MHDRRWGILPHYVTLRIAILPNFFERRYIHDSEYALNVRRWLDWFPPQQIYLVRSQADNPADGQFADLVHFLGAEPGPAPVLGVVNQNILPRFPQLHRHATFGAAGSCRTLCRAFDPVNRWLGERFGPEPYTQEDITAVKTRLGENATLEPLRALAEQHAIPGRKWLTSSSLSQ